MEKSEKTRSRIHWQDQPITERANPQQKDMTACQDSHQETTPAYETVRVLGRDITHQAQKGTLRTFIGREPELLTLQRILLQKNKNSVILVGAPGVGKTALVEGLAWIRYARISGHW